MMSTRTTILTFHGVGPIDRQLDPGESDVWVDHQQYLALLDRIAGRDDVQITFDDGNASDLELGLPALSERGLRATFFVVAGRLGAPGFLDEPDVRTLRDAGMRIGSHGMHHRPWRGLDDRTLYEEVVDAKSILERVVGSPVTQAGCPFGAYDRRVLRAAHHAGFRHVYTSDRGSAAPHAFVQARNSIGPHDPPEVMERIAALEASLPRLAARRARQAIKRWR
jgi:peptidoglycan/xylan/chitin deacetylase (PgdA/CDA1 family)